MAETVPISLRLRSGRGGVVTPFLDRVKNSSGIQQVLFVSPWITHVSFKTGNTQLLMRLLKDEGARVTIVTREPDADNNEHQQFVQDGFESCDAEVIFVDKLHAKFYYCATVRREFAVVGSPNLYRWTEDSYEVAVEIEGRGEGTSIVEGLYRLGLELRSSGRVASF